MRLVSDNSSKIPPKDREAEEREKAIDWARRGLNWPLRELASNMMRITRGAGKPELVGRQVANVLAAFEEYREATGLYPSAYEVQEILALDEPKDHWRDWDWGQLDMVKGGLQVAASQLVGQGTQEAAGRHEMFEGLAVIERIREENRREMNRPKPFSARNKKPRSKIKLD